MDRKTLKSLVVGFVLGAVFVLCVGALKYPSPFPIGMLTLKSGVIISGSKFIGIGQGFVLTRRGNVARLDNVTEVASFATRNINIEANRLVDGF